MRSNGDILINLKSLSITTLTLYMLTASLYIAVFNSLSIQIVILITILGTLILNEVIKNGSILLIKTDVFFLIATITVLGSLHGFTLITSEFAEPVIISIGMIISIFIRGSIENYNYSFRLIRWGGVFYALSVMLTYFFPSLYQTLFLSQLRPTVSTDILTSLENGYYTGFTGQVGYTAGYIVNALGLVFCGWIAYRKGFSKKEIFVFLILFIGLLLTQKRAHLLFLFLSLFIVYIQFTSDFYVKMKKIIKTAFIIILVIIPFVILTSLTSIGRMLFARFYDTIHAFSLGKDITSNRIPLLEHAWDIFLQNPVFGIGWGNFRETVVGNVTDHTEMETHNIYLQLLSETGIVGTVFILTPFLLTYIYTMKITRMLNRKKDYYSYEWKMAVLFSLFIQTFFLLYGLTGNPLYDYSFLFMYFLSFGLIYSFWQSNKRKNSTYNQSFRFRH